MMAKTKYVYRKQVEYLRAVSPNILQIEETIDKDTPDLYNGNVCGAYLITCLVNHKYMVGSSVNIIHRWKDHKYDLKNNIHCNPDLQEDWNKYGEESFIFEVMDYCCPEDVRIFENYWARELKSHDPIYGYNIAPINTEDICIRTSKYCTSVIQLLPDGTFVKEWRSRKDIKDKLGLNVRLSKDKPKVVGGYIFIEKGDYNAGVIVTYEYMVVGKFSKEGKLVDYYPHMEAAAVANGIQAQILWKKIRLGRKSGKIHLHRNHSYKKISIYEIPKLTGTNDK